MRHETARYQQELKRTRQAVRNHVGQMWRALPDYRDNNRELFLDNVVPVVKAGQERAVSLTAAYMSSVLGLASPVSLPFDKLTGAAVRNGIDPREVYARPFATLYQSIAVIGFAAALDKALNRLEATADMDVAMSARDASQSFGQESGGRVQWFQRVADPGCCDFCQSIDGAKISMEDPAPLHNNCSCTVEPLEGSGSDLPELVVQQGETMGDTEIQMHGELGPYIYPKDRDFTGPEDLPDDYLNQLAKIL